VFHYDFPMLLDSVGLEGTRANCFRQSAILATCFIKWSIFFVNCLMSCPWLACIVCRLTCAVAMGPSCWSFCSTFCSICLSFFSKCLSSCVNADSIFCFRDVSISSVIHLSSAR